MQIRMLAEAAADRLANSEDGRISVRRLLDAQPSAAAGPLVLVTSRDLSLHGCESLFGYADRRRGVAVVSTFRLSADGEARLTARLANVIAHERGHLDGLSHCNSEVCIMRPSQSVRDVDARGLERCPRCRRPRRAWKVQVAAAVFPVLVLAAVHASAGLVKVKSPPFSWRAEGGVGDVLYQRRPVLALASEAEARAAAQALNGLYVKIIPPPIEATAEGSRTVLRAGGAMLAEIGPRTAGGIDPMIYARAWAARTGWLMRAKGTEAEGCPDCHIRRLSEVEEAVRRRQRRW